jgi:phage terminase large subunit-like protein
MASLTDDEALALRYNWHFWARATQRIPAGDWRYWLVSTSRGWGKTKVGAETIREWIETGKCKRVALVNDTAADVRDVMVEGPDGLMAVCPPWNKPHYEPSKRRLTWKNGAVAICYSAESPDLLRGPQHDGAWADEFAKWRHLLKADQQGATAWTNMLMGLRIGDDPRAVVTTTPRPIKAYLDLRKNPRTHLTTGIIWENRANLADAYMAETIKDFEGTRLGRQELYGEVLSDTPGALWKLDTIPHVPAAPPMDLIVVGIDPGGSTSEGAAETGIIVAGRADGRAYILADGSGKYSPDGWANKAIDLYLAYEADRFVAETNYGGEMVAHTLRTAAQARGLTIRVQVVTATRGKALRAEPIVALYEQSRAIMVGSHPVLEDQMCSWVPGEGKSPDRIDAMVYACWALLVRALHSQASPSQPEPEPAAKPERSDVEEAVLRGGLWLPGG